MSYDKTKDVLVEAFDTNSEVEDKGTQFAVMKYDGGMPKLQITRRFGKKDGTIGYSSLGRLTLEEVQFLKKRLDKIEKIMIENIITPKGND